MVSVCLKRSRGRISLLTRILVKIMSRKSFHKLYAKSFVNSAKDRYFLIFNNDSRNMFVKTSEENYFLIFLIMLPKHVLVK